MPENTNPIETTQPLPPLPIWKSRKFWLTVAGVATVLGQNYLGLTETQVMTIVGLFAALIGGISLEDHGAKSGRTP